MAFELVILHKALAELDKAVEWYEEQQPGLGEKLYNAYLTCLEHLAENPDHYGYIYKQYRRYPLDKFPYKIVFVILDNKVVIHAFFHNRRNDAELMKRL